MNETLLTWLPRELQEELSHLVTWVPPPSRPRVLDAGSFIGEIWRIDESNLALWRDIKIHGNKRESEHFVVCKWMSDLVISWKYAICVKCGKRVLASEVLLDDNEHECKDLW